jgi:hypothetical protein
LLLLKTQSKSDEIRMTELMRKFLWLFEGLIATQQKPGDMRTNSYCGQ